MNIGFFLKKIRKEKHFTLNEVAKSTNLTASLLSQIENDKTSPSLNSLEVLLKYYKVNISDFFKQVEQKSHIFIKAAEKETLVNTSAGVKLSLLASKLENNVLESFSVYLSPASSITAARLKPDISGERFFYMISGSAVVKLNEDNEYRMSPGDSLNFKSYVACVIKNDSQSEDCEFLLIGNPPIFI
jgi:transcriptional regulator with XRE-family HTH domain